MASKKYGLIIPEKEKQLKFEASRNVFGNDSDSDHEGERKLTLPEQGFNIKRKAKVIQEKNMLEDPTVYQYDEIYDSMVSQKHEKTIKSKEDKKPQYIQNLIKSANRRKIENERRVERQIQKEREEEGDEFADKEVFVTSAYKKKLEEMKLEEEREQREEYLESIGDVTKQQDLGGFYRHLYQVKLGSDKSDETNVKTTDTSADKEDKGLLNESNPNPLKKFSQVSDRILESKKRNYRKRKSSSDIQKQLSEGEIDESEDEINRVNLNDLKHAKKLKPNENIDADSDFDESSDDEKEEVIKENHKKEDVQISNLKHESDDKIPQKNVVEKDKDIEKVCEPKVDIWKKRTVGAVLELALKRYYERKAARSA